MALYGSGPMHRYLTNDYFLDAAIRLDSLACARVPITAIIDIHADSLPDLTHTACLPRKVIQRVVGQMPANDHRHPTRSAQLTSVQTPMARL